MKNEIIDIAVSLKELEKIIDDIDEDIKMKTIQKFVNKIEVNNKKQVTIDYKFEQCTGLNISGSSYTYTTVYLFKPGKGNTPYARA